MRHFLLGLGLVVFLGVSVAGWRGSKSRRPPLELFADMDRQPKLRPQTLSPVFPDQFASRPPVPGTVARGSPFEDSPFHTGRIPGTTNFAEVIPAPVTAGMLARGQERYRIHCAVCHGAAGDGRGITGKYQMVGMASFHDRRLVAMPDGEIFHTITCGKNLMGAYGPDLAIADRWAVIVYVRALQRSALGTLEDVPEPMRASLP